VDAQRTISAYPGGPCVPLSEPSDEVDANRHARSIHSGIEVLLVHSHPEWLVPGAACSNGTISLSGAVHHLQLSTISTITAGARTGTGRDGADGAQL
jgi:hypothetical protein